MGVRHLQGLDTGIDTTALLGISRLVERASGRQVALNKSIVGSGVFTHESGIHTDGLAKNSSTYESFDPAELGRERQIVLGKHSGSQGVRQAYDALGVALSEHHISPLLTLIRNHAMQYKRAPSISELQRFLCEIHETAGEMS